MADQEAPAAPRVVVVGDPFKGAPAFLQHRPQVPEPGRILTREERRALRGEAIDSPKLANPADLSDLADVCQQFAYGTGCDQFLFGFFLPALGAQARFVLNGYPPEWFARYNDLGYIYLDPVVTRVSESGAPFEWSELKVTKKAVIDFFADAASYGVCAGFTVRAQTFLNGQGALNFSSRNPNWTLGEERREVFGESMLFAGRVADAVFRMLERLADFKKRTEGLTERQLEVLDLASRGMQNKQIADHLGISVATCVFHLNKAMEHLGVPNRSAAVAFAVQTGLVNTSRPSKLVPHTEYLIRGPHAPEPARGIPAKTGLGDNSE